MAKKLIATIVPRLNSRVRSFKGQEVEDTAIAQDADNIKKLQDQEVAFASFLECSKAFYKNRFGLDYSRRVWNDPTDANQQTEAIRLAREVLAKHKTKVA